ncbi:MAG: DinB family protein [bacterium]|nr:DinB family protein [bacterium]
MNADAFRHLYNYHFSENRKLWDAFVMPLSQEQFTQPIAYSIGSVRNHIVHLMAVDNAWFSGLRGVESPDWLKPEDFSDKQVIREYWDTVEKNMRDFLANLRDDQLFTKPIADNEEDKDLIMWQVLIHVVNHGTDHRAQLLRLISDLGVKTAPQDYIFYVYDNLM